MPIRLNALAALKPSLVQTISRCAPPGRTTIAAPLLCDESAGKGVILGSWTFFTHQSCARSGSPRCACDPGAPFGHSLITCGARAGVCANVAADINIVTAAMMFLRIMRPPPIKTLRRAFPASPSGQPVSEQLEQAEIALVEPRGQGRRAFQAARLDARPAQDRTNLVDRRGQLLLRLPREQCKCVGRRRAVVVTLPCQHFNQL